MPNKRQVQSSHKLEVSDCHIRPAAVPDTAGIVEVLNSSFPEEWTLRKFREYVDIHDCSVKVVQYKQHVVGVMAYEVLKLAVRIRIIAVTYWARRQGIGTLLLKEAARLTEKSKRKIYRFYVRERDEDALKFFRSQKPTTCTVLRNHFEDTDEDAYVMEFSLEHI
jgi:[ribosomal protein S18]-alanine N-acetyltransferase